ncbi:hypothetical protein ACTPOK_09595 [Streptomyces inhibens]|uniref:hypothetical protein n=1 Tax=Streptomyces inhibens TaxID=2293571 RepID=UPI00402A715C
MGHGESHAAVVQKLTTAVYPGFEEFSTYFNSCSSGFPEFTPGVFVKEDAIWFGDRVVRSDPHGVHDSVGPVDEMDAVLNRTEFQWMWHLLPAGTDAFTAFIQLYTMKHASDVGLGGRTGTFKIRVTACCKILEQQLEGPHTQTHRMTLSVAAQSWGADEVIIYLAAKGSEVAMTAPDGTTVSASFNPTS